jgi:hypothetical protein
MWMIMQDRWTGHWLLNLFLYFDLPSRYVASIRGSSPGGVTAFYGTSEDIQNPPANTQISGTTGL